MSEDDVVVTGLGVVTPLGIEPDTLWQQLLAGKCAARPWQDLAEADFRHTIACRIDCLPSESGSRGRDLAVIAARDALKQAGLRVPPPGTGVFVGSTMGESASFEAAAVHGGGTAHLRTETCVAFPRAIAAAFHLEGPVRAYGTACAAGNYAIGAAAQQLRLGRVDVALAGGAEPFSRIAMTGFSRSRAMCGGVCRPFDKARDGMLLGEGAAILVLERASDATARGAQPLAVVGALGLTCDAYHPTAPHPDGIGAAEAFRHALNAQGLAAEQVDWVCAHGTGTLLSDAAEAKAIASVFGTRPPRVSSIKGALGHAMGAASAIEAAVCVLAIEHGQLPPTQGLEDPAFDLPFIQDPVPCRVGWVANAAFAFGGLNSVLLLGAP